MHTDQVSPIAKRRLDEAVEHVEHSGSLEFHLPENVTSLDKAALLAVIYRLASLSKENE